MYSFWHKPLELGFAYICLSLGFRSLCLYTWVCVREVVFLYAIERFHFSSCCLFSGNETLYFLKFVIMFVLMMEQTLILSTIGFSINQYNHSWFSNKQVMRAYVVMQVKMHCPLVARLMIINCNENLKLVH